MWPFARFDYAAFEYYLAATQLVLATLGMGVALRPRDFGQVLRTPRALLLLLAAQLVLTPLLALAVDAAFRLPQGFALGLVLMAAMPVGAMAGIFVHLGRGRPALALTATGVSTLISLLTTTIVLRVFGSGQLPSSFQMPMSRLLVEFAACLLAPLVVAMVFARVAPSASARAGKWCLRGSLVTMTTLIVGSLTSGRLQVAAYGWRAPAAIGVFAAGSLVLCYALGWLLSLSVPESFTVGVLTTIRNGNLGLLLKASLFPAVAGASPMANAVLYVVLFYSGTALVVSCGAVVARRMREGRTAIEAFEANVLVPS
jgi:BASS family bile acid:Na+ symporter